MSTTEAFARPCPPEPLPESFVSAQPGGGVCYRLELVWGRWRRWWLKRFRPGYVRRMAELRRGDPGGAPHEILDPRDLKYARVRCRCEWDQADNPFRWRERLPFAQWGLAELQVMGWPLLGLTVLLACSSLGYLAWAPGLALCLVVYFFRDPPRRVPQDPAMVVSPADGKITEVTHLERDAFVGGPAVRIGIFLSVFDVHINRAPVAARVMALRYRRGKFFNALRRTSALDNEHTWIGLEEQAPPHRRMVVRQISGAVARRIVCDLQPGEAIARGHKFGMIKLGSRTELILPDGGDLSIQVEVGRRVKAGNSVVARYAEKPG